LPLGPGGWEKAAEPLPAAHLLSIVVCELLAAAARQDGAGVAMFPDLQ
jgi:hypothetical protein